MEARSPDRRSRCCVKRIALCLAIAELGELWGDWSRSVLRVGCSLVLPGLGGCISTHPLRLASAIPPSLGRPKQPDAGVFGLRPPRPATSSQSDLRSAGRAESTWHRRLTSQGESLRLQLSRGRCNLPVVRWFSHAGGSELVRDGGPRCRTQLDLPAIRRLRSPSSGETERGSAGEQPRKG